MNDFKVGDFVTYIPNGIVFRVENAKVLKWMQDSGEYAKLIEDPNRKPMSLKEIRIWKMQRDMFNYSHFVDKKK